MADTKTTFDIFGPVTKNEIRVGYISTDRGYVPLVDLCEANKYEKDYPGTTFIYENRDKVLYLSIDEVNLLKPEDLLPSSTAADGSCGGLQLDTACDAKTIANFYGGGGVGVVGNPVIGTDGAILAVDLVHGGFGYQYPPIVEVKNGCDIGDGSLFESILSDEGYTINTLKYYEECPGIESKLNLCPETPVEKAGWGRMFNAGAVDVGPWDPSKYTANVLADPIDLEMEDYKKELAEFKNPFWTTRSNTGIKITSGDKVTSLKYDVYHWAWGSNPGINPKGEIDNLYIKLLGRRGEPAGIEYWENDTVYGGSLEKLEEGFKLQREWTDVCFGECKPVMPDVTYKFGTYWEYDKANFMNKYAISPEPMSNVLGTDGKGDSYSMEWDIDFPRDGNYTFVVQCDNEGTLFIDGEKQQEYNIGAGGAAGNTLSAPSKKMVKISKGTHPVRFDIVNLVKKKKVVKPEEFTTKTNNVDFKFSTATWHGATASIEDLDMYIEKGYGPNNDVSKDFNRDVEYGRIYDVILTSNTFRTENLAANSNQITYINLHDPKNGYRWINSTRIEFDEDPFYNGKGGWDCNAALTIDNVVGGTATFNQDGKSIDFKGKEVKVTLTFTYNDKTASDGFALDQVKIGRTSWTRNGFVGSETHTITLTGGVMTTGSDASAGVKLRTQGENVLQMEDIPHIKDQDIFFDDVILTASQGKFFDIQGNKAKYTLDAPLPVDRSSSSGTDDPLKVFDTVSFIDKASRKLWKTNNLSPQQRQDSSHSFSNRYGITPFNPTIEHNTNYPGFHKIVWSNITFPATAEYDITIAVDDNVRLRIGDQVDIQKDGFAVRGDWRTATGTTVYRKKVKEGTYTLTADLEQIPGGKYGMDANSMLLAIDIRAIGSLGMEVEKKSWNQNPFAVALSIEAPPPLPPAREIPDVGEGCPENPIWSTMSPGSSESWYPCEFKPWSEFTNKYALSPVPPLDTPGTDGVGVLYKTSWKMTAPYGGYYTIKGTVEDTGKILVNDREITDLSSPTEVCPRVKSTKVYLSEGTHNIEVQVENKKDYETPKFFIDQKIFNTQDWQNQNSGSGGQVKDIDFKVATATWHGATASMEALGIYVDKKYGPNNDVTKEFRRTVEYGRVYDVVLTSNTFRTARVGNSKDISYINLHAKDGYRWINSTRIEFDEDPNFHGKGGWDCNGALTIDNVVGGTATFNRSGKSIDFKGKSVKVTLTFTWSDATAADGYALDQIRIGGTSWTWAKSTGTEGRYTYVPVGDQGVLGLEGQKGPPRSWKYSNLAGRYDWEARVSLFENGWEVQRDDGKWYPSQWEDDDGEGWTSIKPPPPPSRPMEGSETHTITLGSENVQIGDDMTSGIELKTKGDTVLLMEDVPGTDMGGGGVGKFFDDVIITTSEGRFFGINGNKAKFVLPNLTTNTTTRDGIVYKGPALYNYKHRSYGTFMNKSGVSPDYPKFGGGEIINYEWSNVDFPRAGEYDFHFANDAHGSLYLDGNEIIKGDFDNEIGVSSRDSANWRIGIEKRIKVSKGKHTLTVAPPDGRLGETTGWADGLFKKTSDDYYRGQQAFDNDPSAFSLGITIKTETTPEVGSKEELLQRGKSWVDNPTAISAIMIPPPCPKKIKGKGVVVDVIVDDPGGPYPTPEQPPDIRYPITLRLKKVIPTGGGNYDPGDPTKIVFPPYIPEEIETDPPTTPPPFIPRDKDVSIKAVPPKIPRGKCVILKYTSSGCTFVRIDPDVGEVPAVREGSVRVCPSTTTTYTITGDPPPTSYPPGIGDGEDPTITPPSDPPTGGPDPTLGGGGDPTLGGGGDPTPTGGGGPTGGGDPPVDDSPTDTTIVVVVDAGGDDTTFPEGEDDPQDPGIGPGQDPRFSDFEGLGGGPTPISSTGDKIVITPDNGAKLTPIFGPHGTVVDVRIDDPGLGFTEYPTISMPSETGVGVVFKPQFEIIRDPLGVTPDKLLQVTDLVGLKQTGYVDGRSYYGSVFFENDIKYAGMYETIGQKIRVYDTMQDSIDAMDRSDPSAIQRSGTDVSSNDPRLDIPNTPDNLI